MDTTTLIKNCVDTAYLEKSRQTARSYKNGLEIFQKSIGNRAITVDTFIEFPVYLMRQNLSRSSIGVYLATAHYLMDWMVIGGYLAPTYAETLRLKKAESGLRKRRRKTLPKTPRRGDAEKMLDAIRSSLDKPIVRERNIAMLEFLASTGCRNNEIVQLQIRDLDMEDQSAIVLGKGDKERRVYFSNVAADALKNYWETRGFVDRNDPVFARHDKGCGKKVLHITTATVRDIVAATAAKAGIDKNAFTPHSFRHAYAITMYQITHDLAMVQDLLGHGDPATTRIYATIYPEQIKETYQKAFNQ